MAAVVEDTLLERDRLHNCADAYDGLTRGTEDDGSSVDWGPSPLGASYLPELGLCRAVADSLALTLTDGDQRAARRNLRERTTSSSPAGPETPTRG